MPLPLPASSLLLATLFVAGASVPAQDPAPAPQSRASDQASRRPPRLEVGQVAPAFTVLGPTGETIGLEQFAGKVLIVDVSATWCGPCQAAMPNNDRVFLRYKDQGVVLLAVTADDSRAAYDGWLERNAGRYSFTMAFDPAGKDGWADSVFNKQYHVTGFPTMFVIGRDGKLVETVGGGGPGEDHKLEYALSRAGVKVDLASLPPEPKKEGPRSIPAVRKTPAMSAAARPLPDKFGSLAAGQPMPDLALIGRDGKPLASQALTKGKPYVVVFCTAKGPPPSADELVTSYRKSGLVVLAVFAATEREAFDAWVEKNAASEGLVVGWDPAGKAWAEGLSNVHFGIGMYPATAVVDKQGKLVGGTVGFGADATVKALLVKSGDVEAASRPASGNR